MPESSNGEVSQVVEPSASVDSQSTAEVAKDTATEQPQSVLDAVKSALNADKGTDQQPESTSRVGDDGSNDSPTSNATQEPQSEEDKFAAKLSDKNRDNWRKLQAERDTFRDKAQRFDAISQMVSRSGLTSEEIDNAFAIAAMMKRDPGKALEMLSPHVSHLRQSVGDEFPADIQQMVEDGSISTEAAKQLTKARFDAYRANTNAERLLQTVERGRAINQQRAVQAMAQQVGNAVTDWETRWKQNDPDYSVKQPLVRSRVAELVSERGTPRTMEEAIRLAEEAREQVDKQLAPVIRRTGNAVRTVTGGQSNGKSVAAPSSALDAARLALSGQYQFTG